jgi:hypothetical protein
LIIQHPVSILIIVFPKIRDYTINYCGIKEGEITLTTVKKFLKNHGWHLKNGGLLSILQKTKDDDVGSILC